MSNLVYADGYERSPTTFKAVYSPVKRSCDKFDGVGITYSQDGIPVSGTVTGYSGVDGGRKVPPSRALRSPSPSSSTPHRPTPQ